MRLRKVKLTQLCPTPWDPMDYTVSRILHARTLEWVAVLFSRGSSQPRDWAQVSHMAGRCFTSWVTRRSWSWLVLWWPTRTSRANTKKRCSFHHRGLECKVGSQEDTWSNRQVWPWSTKWSRVKANRVLPKHNGHSKHSFLQSREFLTVHGIL